MSCRRGNHPVRAHNYKEGVWISLSENKKVSKITESSSNMRAKTASVERLQESKLQPGDSTSLAGQSGKHISVIQKSFPAGKACGPDPQCSVRFSSVALIKCWEAPQRNLPFLVYRLIRNGLCVLAW